MRTGSASLIGWLGAFALLLLAAAGARAEGSLGPELDTSQALRGVTDVHADVLDFRTDTIVWTGKGAVDVIDPSGASVGTFASGATITPTMNGAYELDLQEDQFDVDAGGNIIRSTIVPWDVTVLVSGVARPGRVWSREWAFNTGSFARAASTNASFYARVPGGDTESFAVMELRTVGLAGFIFEIQGNHSGVRGPNAGRSVPEMMHSAANEYQIYLNPPDDASYTFVSPTVSDFAFRGGLEASGGVETCDEFVPGASMGEFSFTTNVAGTFHIVCDQNGDGLFDIVDDGDYLILGTAEPGVNRIPFDGLDNDGNPFALGDLECIVRVTVGEFHYVGRDIETSFEGLRMFQVSPDGTRSPLDMYWNDALVQSNAVTMPTPYNYIAASTSGPMGLDSGDPTAAPVPLGEGRPRTGANSRAWGDFVSFGTMGNGKGNEAYLDTYTWLDEALSTTITIRATDGTLDTDGEGLTDYVERCTTGTDPMDPDSDGDSVNDFVETLGGMPGVDNDGDGTVDALDEDDDDDCVPTRLEDPDGDGDPTNDDTDGDGIPNYLDEDDDGDGMTSCAEDRDGDGDPTNDDSDGDGIPDYLELDSDGDCDLRAEVPAIMCNDTDDACPTEREVVNDYMDEDGCPEPDRDGDGIPDDVDNCPDHPNPDQPDLDGDGLGDECDDDIDGDGLPNACEVVASSCPRTCMELCHPSLPTCTGCGGSDPRDPDTDDGGRNDLDEVVRGSDPLDPIDDPLPGRVTGGGIFHCAAGGSGGRAPWALFVLAGALIAVRRRRRRG
jgi:hypothetical protein